MEPTRGGKAWTDSEVTEPQELLSEPLEFTAEPLEISHCSAAFSGAAQAVWPPQLLGWHWTSAEPKALVSPTPPQPQSCQVPWAISTTPHAPFFMDFLQHHCAFPTSGPLFLLTAECALCSVTLGASVPSGVLLGDPPPPTRRWGSTLSHTLPG